jgi:hypothetical protein
MIVFFTASWTHTKPSRELLRASAVADMDLPESERTQSASSLYWGHRLMDGHLCFKLNLLYCNYLYIHYVWPHFFVLITLKNWVFSSASASRKFLPSPLVSFSYNKVFWSNKIAYFAYHTFIQILLTACKCVFLISNFCMLLQRTSQTI